MERSNQLLGFEPGGPEPTAEQIEERVAELDPAQLQQLGNLQSLYTGGHEYMENRSQYLELGGALGQ